MNSNKIAIMTWYKYNNYGSVLQSCALSYICRKMGYEPYMINYFQRQAYTELLTKKRIREKIMNTVKEKFNPKHKNSELDDLYHAFKEGRIEETVKCNTYSELHMLNDKYDAFICGSDQIWAPSCFDDKYFLSFVDDDNKKIAYAPSIGLNNISNPQVKGMMRNMIGRFKHLSVREVTGAKIVKNLTGKEAKIALDPSLLLQKEEWSKYVGILDSVSKIEEDYMICYFLGAERRYYKYVAKIEKKLGIKAYIIPVQEKSKFQKVPFEVGPKEFVDLIKNAKYVCTDSLHGTIFSIIYNIPFSTFERFKDCDPVNQNSRIYHLLHITHLESRLVKSEKDITIDCDFGSANSCLEFERTGSFEYLENALKTATKNVKNKNEIDKVYEITKICCGCGACASICKEQAIEIELDGQGFYHYHIDQERCMRCGMCKRVCPFENVTGTYLEEKDILYSFKSKEEKVLMRSSSGGFSHEILKNYLGKNHIVCACEYSNIENKASHSFCVTFEGLTKFQGSKYIQSKTSVVLKDISRHGDRKYIFVGTPCQCAGLDHLLKIQKKRERVMIIDLICHGVPSIYLWDSYLLSKEIKVGKHPYVDFRYKPSGWRNLSIRIRKATDEIGAFRSERRLAKSEHSRQYILNEKQDDFYAFFRNGHVNMMACFECPYRDRSCADIRIGDFWGDQYVKDPNGVSMVIPMTAKGEEAFHELREMNAIRSNRFSIREFFIAQYPYNMPKPYFRDNLIEELRIGSNLAFLRKKYEKNYEIQEWLVRFMDAPLRKKGD